MPIFVYMVFQLLLQGQHLHGKREFAFKTKDATGTTVERSVATTILSVQMPVTKKPTA
jgi:hypothetical protein